ncbi:hypothetical protein [Cohaesibacter haloalkalitolerans]|uniref:hypothetical protein n=1 Tax=Cohaesibacter haloalkalitolerans TaxID=1162980 RepID=UPI000E651F28|nr:hypothetical protein [Cohaesibacter haloalkalitolerans]
MNSAAKARDLIYSNIDAIMRNSQRLQALETVSLVTLLDEAFMREHCTVKNIAALFALAGQSEVSEQALDAIPDSLWDELVRRHSTFNSWDEMYNKAAQRFVRARLLEGIEQD